MKTIDILCLDVAVTVQRILQDHGHKVCLIVVIIMMIDTGADLCWHMDATLT